MKTIEALERRVAALEALRRQANEASLLASAGVGFLQISRTEGEAQNFETRLAALPEHLRPPRVLHLYRYKGAQRPTVKEFSL